MQWKIKKLAYACLPKVCQRAIGNYPTILPFCMKRKCKLIYGMQAKSVKIMEIRSIKSPWLQNFAIFFFWGSNRPKATEKGFSDFHWRISNGYIDFQKTCAKSAEHRNVWMPSTNFSAPFILTQSVFFCIFFPSTCYL